jgi:diadenylate cyclase
MNTYYETISEFYSSQSIKLIRDIIDIALVSYFIYKIFTLVSGTRAIQVIKGIFILFIFYVIVQYVLQLKTMAWIMQNLATLIIVALPIVFQPELRRFLAHIGQDKILIETIFNKGKDLFNFINIIILTSKNLSAKKTGALIIIERNIGLNDFIETGIKVDAELSPDILETIFYSGTPLHDGAVVIRNNRVVAASVLLPLSENIRPISGKHNLGTRHRAGLGLAEVTDAICIIISEETGDITLAHKGKLYRHLNEDSLEKMLIDACQNKNKGNNLNIEHIETQNKDKLKEQTNKLKKQSKNNSILKILSILCALLCVFFISKANISNIDEKIFFLPVQTKYKDNIQKNKVQIVPNYVSVKLIGDKQILDKLKTQDLNVSINIENIKENQVIPVSVLAPTDVTIKEVNPKDVLINVYNK